MASVPHTTIVIAAVGIAVIVSVTTRTWTWFRASPSLVRAEADDASSLVRMDDDGGSQMTRPSA
jgi:hypothetical protein